jgi:hypothetical protein
MQVRNRNRAVPGKSIYSRTPLLMTFADTRTLVMYVCMQQGALIGLGATGTSLRACEGMSGVWQQYIVGQQKLSSKR